VLKDESPPEANRVHSSDVRARQPSFQTAAIYIAFMAVVASLAPNSVLTCQWGGPHHVSSVLCRGHVSRPPILSVMRCHRSKAFSITAVHGKKKKRLVYASRQSDLEILVPVQPDYSDLWRLNRVVEMIKDGAVSPTLLL